MPSPIPTIIIRHKKENLKKCSLRGLEQRDDCIFYTYPLKVALPSLESTLVLALDAEPLTAADAGKSLLLIDATWRFSEKMLKNLPPPFLKRSLPPFFRTAYPRKQTDCIDPDRGLASIEALFLAYTILGRDTRGLLDNYHWKEQFLMINDAKNP